MTQAELIDRLCSVNCLLTDIVREQSQIMAMHGIEAIQSEEETENSLTRLYGMTQKAEEENDAIEAAIRRL